MLALDDAQANLKIVLWLKSSSRPEKKLSPVSSTIPSSKREGGGQLFLPVSRASRKGCWPNVSPCIITFFWTNENLYTFPFCPITWKKNMDHRGGGRMFSQRSNEKWSSPLSLAIDADKNFFLIIWYLLDKNERERRVISSASGGGITASVGSINSVETLGEKKEKKKEGFWKWCTVTQPGFRTGCGDFPRKENILLANRILLRKYRTMYATIATVFTIYRRLRMDTRWLVVIACLVTFDLLIGVFSSRLITVRAGETSGGGEGDPSIYPYLSNFFPNRSSRWESGARKSRIVSIILLPSVAPRAKSELQGWAFSPRNLWIYIRIYAIKNISHIIRRKKF